MKFICSPKLCKICEKINKENRLRKITGSIRIYCEELWFSPESKCCNLSAGQSAAWNMKQWASAESETYQNQQAVSNYNRWTTGQTQTIPSIPSKSAKNKAKILKRLKLNDFETGHNERDFMGAIVIIIALILFCFIVLQTFSILLKIRKMIFKRYKTKETTLKRDFCCNKNCLKNSAMLRRKSIFDLKWKTCALKFTIHNIFLKVRKPIVINDEFEINNFVSESVCKLLLLFLKSTMRPWEVF